MISRRFWKFASAFLILFTGSCIKRPVDVVGSGSESPNAVTGTVYMPAGVNFAGLYKVAPEAEVLIYSIVETDSGFSWDTIVSILTDVNGQFIVDSISFGSYSILVQKEGLKDFAYFDYNLELGAILVDSVLLKPTQKIEGTIKDTAGTNDKIIYLGLVGTPYLDTVGINGH